MRAHGWSRLPAWLIGTGAVPWGCVYRHAAVAQAVPEALQVKQQAYAEAVIGVLAGGGRCCHGQLGALPCSAESFFTLDSNNTRPSVASLEQHPQAH